MTAIKITKFFGTAPKNSPELLADTAAQVARNAKLYSGDLIPYPVPVVVDNTKRTGVIRTLHGIRKHGETELKWLSFAGKVNVVTPATDELEEHRFYYTGDGKPKVSTFALATDGGQGPYPLDYYDLGLPLPTTKPTATLTPFSAATAISFSRDAANIVTLTTTDNHNLKSGAIITISGFTFRTGTYTRTNTTITITISDHGLSTGANIYLEFTSGTATTNVYTITVLTADTFSCTDTVSGATSGNVRWDIRDLNTVSEVIVVDDTTISYFAAGPKLTKTTVIKYGEYTQAASATATITSVAHKLITGDLVYLEFTSGDAAAESGTFTVTVTGVDTFTVVLPTSRTTSGEVDIYLAVGKVDLGDQIQGRNYLYTWYTPWREESIGSEPIDPVFMREGQIVTITDLPNIPPDGKYNIRGIRLYRTVATTTDSAFFLLKTLWFPAPITALSRTSSTVRVTMRDYHNLIVKDRVKLICGTNGDFDATDAVVTRIIDARTFEFIQPGDDAATFTATGILYYDIAEKRDDSARYWGLNGDFTFIDDFSFRSLLSILRSTEYEQPPEALQGLTVIQNNILAGFVGNDLYFSEPGLYHAWPSQYRRSLEFDIVALAPFGGMLLVLTKGYPYLVEGASPATFALQKLSILYPCLSATSVTQTPFGVVWATHDGLAVFGSSTATQLLTKAVHHSDTWYEATNPSELTGAVFKDNFIGSSFDAALTLESVENDGSTGFSFVDLDFMFTAAWYDNELNSLYTVSGEEGDIYQWDLLTQPPMSLRWKSKVFITPMPVNLGAARVVADYDGQADSQMWEDIDSDWGDVDWTWNSGASITFNLYVNKELIFTTTRTDSGIFRLPAGYKSDTFEVEVISPLRIRSIHLADTPLLLASV